MINPNTPKGSDIDSLITNFSKMSGFQKTNRFRITITPPANFNIPTDIAIFATTIQTPTQALVFYEDTMSPSGPPISIPLRRNYDDRYIVEFIVDKNWNIRNFFESWMDSIFLNSPRNTISKNSTKVEYWTKIVGKLRIEALDDNDEINQTVILHDVWPKTIIPTQFSNDTPNQYLTLMVDLSYRYYEFI